MSDPNETEVLVVGAGPVGLLAAYLLSKQGVDVQIIDKEWRTATHSYALALHPGTLRLFHELGLGDQLTAGGNRIESLAFYEGGNRELELDFAELPVEWPFLLVVAQDCLEQLLEAKLKEQGVSVMWNHRLASLEPESECVRSTIEKVEEFPAADGDITGASVAGGAICMTSAFVIGADGFDSRLRAELEIDYHSHGDPEHFGVFEFPSDADFGNEMRVVLDEKTTNVLWPLDSGHCRWSLQMDGVETAGEPRAKGRFAMDFGETFMPNLTIEDLLPMLAERAPWFQPRIGKLKWSKKIRFEPRLAARFGGQRCWLVGDAAHQTGPVGVQSMNVGLREASDLAKVLHQILREGAAIEVLESFGEQRLGEWRQLLQIGWQPKPTSHASPWVVERARRILACLPASGDDLARLAAQIGLDMDSPSPKGTVA